MLVIRLRLTLYEAIHRASIISTVFVFDELVDVEINELFTIFILLGLGSTKIPFNLKNIINREYYILIYDYTL